MSGNILAWNNKISVFFLSAGVVFPASGFAQPFIQLNSGSVKLFIIRGKDAAGIRRVSFLSFPDVLQLSMSMLLEGQSSSIVRVCASFTLFAWWQFFMVLFAIAHFLMGVVCGMAWHVHYG